VRSFLPAAEAAPSGGPLEEEILSELDAILPDDPPKPVAPRPQPPADAKPEA
jgi:hypothetical protein